MALTYPLPLAPNSNSTPPSLLNLAPTLQSASISPNAPGSQQSVGVKAVSPQTNTKPVNNTLPPSQVAPRDLSSTYANVGGTIYNKNSGTKFSNAQDFFKDAGVSDFNVKFDSNYTPSGKETIYGQPATPPAPTPPQTTSTSGSTNPAGGAAGSSPTPTPAAPATPQPGAPYSPPNGGTTGVSQGGIIGNLLGIANTESPQVAKARKDLQDLQVEDAKAENDIESRPSGLTQQGGEQGMLARLFAAKQGAAQTALSSALTSQGQAISATQGAGGLNAPQFASPGQVQVSPSQPVLGSTTSGAANLNSLIGQRPGANGVTEFYNSSTGQGFATPQELATFVNSQVPGANVNPNNVFDYLKNNGGSGSNIVGGNSALNPLSQISTIAQQVVSGTKSYPDALSAGGSIPGFNSALNAEITKMNPGFNFNVAQGAASGQQANAQAAQTAAVNAANSAYAGYYQDYLNTKATVDTVDQFGTLLTSSMVDKDGNTVNPFDLKYANVTLSSIRGLLSSQQQAQYDTTLAALKSKISGLLAVGGNETPTQLTADANSILSGSAPLGTLQATLSRIKQEGQAVVNVAAQKGNTALAQVQSGLNPSGSNNSSSSTSSFNW